MGEDGLRPDRSVVRVFVRPYASSIPLGFFSFGIGMLLLGASALGWLPASSQHTTGIFLAAFVFPLEATATIFAFLARDTFSAAGFGLFSTSWLSVGLAYLATAPGGRNPAVGVYLIGFSVAISTLAVAAMSGKPLVGGILAAASVRGFLDGAYQLGAPHVWYAVEGGIAVAIFVAAMYGGIAFLVEDVRKEEVLPVVRRGTSKVSMEEGLGAQLAQVDSEAGVRQTL
jgi:succinate-acetate transporter protein